MEETSVQYSTSGTVQEFLLDFRKTRDFKIVIPLLEGNENFRNKVFEQVGAKEYPFPEYSSWIAIHFFQKHPKLFTENWCSFFIEILLKTHNHSMQRNICTTLFHYKGDLSENTELLDKLFDF